MFQPLVVHGEALHQVFGEPRRRPLPELRSPRTADAVPDREDGLEAVVVELAFDIARPLQSNYPEFPDSCAAVKFGFVENVDEMLIHSSDVFVEQLRNLRLSQPDRFILKATLNSGPAVFRAVENDA